MRALHPSGVCVCCTPSHFSVKSVQDHCEVLTVSGSIWSVSHRASGGLIRSSGVSLFIDLCLLVFVNFFLSVFLKQVLRFLCGEEVLIFSEMDWGCYAQACFTLSCDRSALCAG